MAFVFINAKSKKTSKFIMLDVKPSIIISILMKSSTVANFKFICFKMTSWMHKMQNVRITYSSIRHIFSELWYTHKNIPADVKKRIEKYFQSYRVDTRLVIGTDGRTDRQRYRQTRANIIPPGSKGKKWVNDVSCFCKSYWPVCL